MTLADEIQAVQDELEQLFRAQSSAERAPLEGRETSQADRLAAIDRRAEQIRRLQRRLGELEREWDQDEAA